ncbi:hypothetical protein DL96DRAFT_369040 [Flagelloscypha sp. PMI_526]|nr:hypothetical protein DL96DRAFT_369040 [Flagelloscypha sp. PMI_526]
MPRAPTRGNLSNTASVLPRASPPTLPRRLTPRDIPRFRSRNSLATIHEYPPPKEPRIPEQPCRPNPATHHDQCIQLSQILRQILQFGPLAYKTRDKALRQRVLTTLQAMIRVTNPVFHTMSDWRTYANCLSIARLLGRFDLAREIMRLWQQRMFRWDPLMSPIQTLKVSESWRLPELRPHAYYMYLATAMSKAPSYAQDEPPQYDQDLSPSQNLHVSCGFYSLSTYWKTLVESPPEFPYDEGCVDHTRCLVAWRNSWRAAVRHPLEHAPAIDVIWRLSKVRAALVMDPILSGCMATLCRESGLRAVAEVQNNLFQNIGHHFDLADDELDEP